MADQDYLTVDQGKQGLVSLIQRAIALDENALMRVRALPSGLVDVFVTTPFQMIASRRVQGEISRDGAVLSAQQWLDSGKSIPLDVSWPGGALPPAQGFELVDDIPVQVVRELADQGQALARQFSTPVGVPTSLLDQEVITVENASGSVTIPMRMIFTATSLGLIPGMSAPASIPRHLRVSSHGRWVRLDAPFGTVYKAQGLSLFV